MTKGKSHWIDLLAFQMKAVGLKPVTEFRFHPTRKWRSDFAFPDKMLLVEFEGGVFVKGRHTRGAGFVADCEKYNNAALLGYVVMRFTDKHVKSGEALVMIEQFMGHY